MVSNFLSVAGVGLFFFAAARTGLRLEDYDHFGVWHQAPRWARVLFGAVDGSISPYRLSMEATGLTWAIACLAMYATGDPPDPPLRQILAAAALVSLAACVTCWVIVTLGQELRDWRRK
jgi:hypothetical protein